MAKKAKKKVPKSKPKAKAKAKSKAEHAKKKRVMPAKLRRIKITPSMPPPPIDVTEQVEENVVEVNPDQNTQMPSDAAAEHEDATTATPAEEASPTMSKEEPQPEVSIEQKDMQFQQELQQPPKKSFWQRLFGK